MALFVEERSEEMRSGGAALLIIGNRLHRDNAQRRGNAAHYQQRSRSSPRIFAICRLLSLAHLHTTATGTADSARILHISPRLPLCQLTTTSGDQNAEACPPIIPIHACRFLPLHRHDAYFQPLKEDMSFACIVKVVNCSNFLG
jgi:hypothetical protein